MTNKQKRSDSKVIMNSLKGYLLPMASLLVTSNAASDVWLFKEFDLFFSKLHINPTWRYRLVGSKLGGRALNQLIISFRLSRLVVPTIGAVTPTRACITWIYENSRKTGLRTLFRDAPRDCYLCHTDAFLFGNFLDPKRDPQSTRWGNILLCANLLMISLVPSPCLMTVDIALVQ